MVRSERGKDGRFLPGHMPHNKKPPINKVCPVCGKQFSVYPSLARLICCSASCGQKRRCAEGRNSFVGRKHSLESRAKQRAAKLGIRGPDHWNWRGGYDRTERNLAMTRDEYRQWRTAVFERDDYTCRECGARGNLHAHHVRAWATHPDLRYDIANGLTVCGSCHYEIHWGKQNG